MKNSRTIITLGGGGFSMEPENPRLDAYILSQSHRDRPRICFVPTASGDADGYIERFHRAFEGKSEPTHLSLFDRDDRDLRQFVLDQDIIYVGGGNVANLLVIWRLHGLDAVLREAWDAGVILCGISAGMICWFESSVTDSFGSLSPLSDGLGVLPGSACPHYDGESDRRPAYRQFIADGSLPAGYAADDGAALHFEGARLKRVVCSRPNAQAYRVERVDKAVIEKPLDRLIL